MMGKNLHSCQSGKKKTNKITHTPLKSLKVAPLIRYKLSKLQQAKKKDLLGH